MTTYRMKTLLACAVFALFAGTAQAAPLGPAAYLQASDSPFAGVDFSGGYFFLENFEDHALNVTGATGLTGGPTSIVFGPGVHDSVDADDGVVDGSGLAGDSWFFTGAMTGFSFNAAALGSLPTHAGVVWTDGPFGTSVTFTAYGADGTTVLCMVTGVAIGNNSFSGETAEDRFFGCIDPGGISRIEVLNSLGGGIEVDHLQFGRTGGSAPAVPEPGTLMLVGLGGAALRLRRRLTKRG